MAIIQCPLASQQKRPPGHVGVLLLGESTTRSTWVRIVGRRRKLHSGSSRMAYFRVGTKLFTNGPRQLCVTLFNVNYQCFIYIDLLTLTPPRRGALLLLLRFTKGSNRHTKLFTKLIYKLRGEYAAFSIRISMVKKTRFRLWSVDSILMEFLVNHVDLKQI